MAVADLRDELNCSICLNVYEDPVMLRCGHNFCFTCLGNVLTTQEGLGVYSCPQCRMEFHQRPELQKNIVLKNIADRFQSSYPEVEPSGVLCSHCINSPAPAVKTCVHCEASLCESHVRVHNTSAEHLLIEPTTSLENIKCSNHKKILEYYCCDDSVCICVACRLDGIHKGHAVESIKDALEKKKEKLRNGIQEMSLQKEEVLRRFQTLTDQNDQMIRNADGIKQTITNVFKNIRGKLNVLEKKMLMEICKEQKEASDSITDLIKQLKGDIDKITKKMFMLQNVNSMADPLIVLQDHGVDREMTENDCKASAETPKGGQNIKFLHERMIYRHLFKDLFHTVNHVKRNTLQTDSDIVLDEDTAENRLQVSEDGKMVSYTNIQKSYPMTPKRFRNNQVLSETDFSSGQHYWEVQTSEEGNWRIGVAYASIDITGDQSPIGDNKKSWCLRRFNNKYSVLRDKKETYLAKKISSNSFGVYLDYDAGRLSFYELSEPVRHIHTFSTTFTKPLHAAFLLANSFVQIKNPDY